MATAVTTKTTLEELNPGLFKRAKMISQMTPVKDISTKEAKTLLLEQQERSLEGSPVRDDPFKITSVSPGLSMVGGAQQLKKPVASSSLPSPQVEKSKFFSRSSPPLTAKQMFDRFDATMEDSREREAGIKSPSKAASSRIFSLTAPQNQNPGFFVPSKARAGATAMPMVAPTPTRKRAPSNGRSRQQRSRLETKRRRKRSSSEDSEEEEKNGIDLVDSNDEGSSADERPTAEDEDFIDDGDASSEDSDEESDYVELTSDDDDSDYTKNDKRRMREGRRKQKSFDDILSEDSDSDEMEKKKSKGGEGLLLLLESDGDDGVSTARESDSDVDDSEEEKILLLRLEEEDRENELDDAESAYISTKNAEIDADDNERVLLIRRNYRLCDPHTQPSVYNMMMGLVQAMFKEESRDAFGSRFLGEMFKAKKIVKEGRRWKAGFPFINACFLWLNLKNQCVNELLLDSSEGFGSWLTVFKDHTSLDDKPKYEEHDYNDQVCCFTGAPCRTGISLVDVHDKRVVSTLWYDYHNDKVALFVNGLARLFFLPMAICEWCKRKGFDLIEKLDTEKMASVIRHVENASNIFVQILLDNDIIQSTKGLISIR